MSEQHEELLSIKNTLSAVKDHLLHVNMFFEIMVERLGAQVKYIQDKIQALKLVQKMQIDYLSEVSEANTKIKEGYKSNIKTNESIAQKLESSLRSIENNEKELFDLLNEVDKMSHFIEMIKSTGNCNKFIDDLSMSIEQIEQSVEKFRQRFKENKDNIIHINDDLNTSIHLIKGLNESNNATSLAVDNISTFVENISNNIDNLEQFEKILSNLINNVARLSNENKEKIDQIENAMSILDN